MSGGGLYVILPKKGGAAELLSAMTDDYFDEIQRESFYATGKLLLPRFSIESDVTELRETLSAMGVPLFDKSAAPLTGGLIKTNLPVWLTNAVQKAVIQVDEKGTTAAAVTMTDAGLGAPPPTEPFEMFCDRPFVFVLYGRTYDGGMQVLFTGIVNQT
jgi:serpin B